MIRNFNIIRININKDKVNSPIVGLIPTLSR